MELSKLAASPQHDNEVEEQAERGTSKAGARYTDEAEVSEHASDVARSAASTASTAAGTMRLEPAGGQELVGGKTDVKAAAETVRLA